jgi:hypothetical protein
VRCPNPFVRQEAELGAVTVKVLHDQRLRLRETLLSYAEAATREHRWEAANAFQTAADLCLAYTASVVDG